MLIILDVSKTHQIVIELKFVSLTAVIHLHICVLNNWENVHHEKTSSGQKILEYDNRKSKRKLGEHANAKNNNAPS